MTPDWCITDTCSAKSCLTDLSGLQVLDAFIVEGVNDRQLRTKLAAFDAEKSLGVTHVGIAGKESLCQCVVGGHMGRMDDEYEIGAW